MEVIPAIDIRDGKCVRLYQGDYSRETVYSDDPVQVARQWIDLGATRLHLIDLDGAREGVPSNLALVERVAAIDDACVQLGGGIRTLEAARKALSIGVDRIIVGTRAIEDPAFVAELCAELSPDAVVVGVDAREGYVAVRGWTETTRTLLIDAARRFADMGVVRILFTDVSRDGTLTEPNFDAIDSLIGQSPLALLAAGGISEIAHLTRLASMGVEGAIVGKAMYTGDIRLQEAIESVAEPG